MCMMCVMRIPAHGLLKQDMLHTRPEVFGDSDSMPRGCAAGVELPDELPLHKSTERVYGASIHIMLLASIKSSHQAR